MSRLPVKSNVIINAMAWRQLRLCLFKSAFARCSTSASAALCHGAFVPKQHYNTYIWVNYTYKAHKKLQNYPRQLLHTLTTV